MCVALPGEILEVIDPASCLARVDVLGTPRVINLSLLGEAAPGEWVLVHAGFALERISKAEATETLRWFVEIESTLAASAAAEAGEAGS